MFQKVIERSIEPVFKLCGNTTRVLRKLVFLKKCFSHYFPLFNVNKKILKLSEPLTAGNCQIAALDVIPQSGINGCLTSFPVNASIFLDSLPNGFCEKIQTGVAGDSPLRSTDQIMHNFQCRKQGFFLCFCCNSKGEFFKQRLCQFSQVAEPISNNI